MVRTYIRKTDRQSWSTENVKNARNGLPVKTASRNFGVPRMALKRRVSGTNKAAVSDKKILGCFQPVFTQCQEEELVSHILDMERRLYGLTTRDY